jgi:hypothetical protein
MENKFFRYIVSATIVGIIISACTYYLFSDRKIDPRYGISATVTVFDIPAQGITDTYLKALEISKDDYPRIERLITDALGYSRDIYVQKYKISNDSDREIQDISVIAAQKYFLNLVESPDDREYSQIEPGRKISLMPHQTKFVTAYYSQMEPAYSISFLVEGKAIELPDYWQREAGIENPLVSIFWLFVYLISFIGWCILIFSIVMDNINSKSPKLLINNTSSEAIGLHLALLNYLKIENPQKYSKSVQSAEVRYAEWLRRTTHSESTFDI